MAMLSKKVSHFILLDNNRAESICNVTVNTFSLIMKVSQEDCVFIATLSINPKRFCPNAFFIYGASIGSFVVDTQPSIGYTASV